MAHKHKDEIMRFAKAERGTKVWYKGACAHWSIIDCPLWSEGIIYIVDDAYANVRKFFADNGYIWIGKGNSSEKDTKPDWTAPVDMFSSTRTIAEPGAYWKWKKLVNNNEDIVTIISKRDLSKGGWTRIESSKTTFEGLV